MESLDQQKQISFSSVEERHDKIIILASSQEAIRFKPVDGYAVIAVNDAIHIAKNNADYWFTLDPSESNIKIMHEKPYRAKYYAAVPEWLGTPEAPFERLRDCLIPENVLFLKRISGHKKDNYIKYGLSKRKNEISTGNSAWGAFNLAYHMGAKEIVLLGVSGEAKPKFDNKMCIGSLAHLPLLFESSLIDLDRKKIKVYNANKYTLLKCFEYKDIF